MKPKDPGNIQKISSGHSAAYVQTSAKDLVSGKVNVETSSGIKTFDYGYLALDTSVQMQNLEVRDIYTTSDPDSSAFGAMTMTSVCEGQTITVRTAVLTDDSRKLITADAYMGKTINVKGIVDSYGGTYQIKVLSAKDINIV